MPSHRSAPSYRDWGHLVNSDPPFAPVQSRIWKRLRQRYARWLVQHPAEGCCQSKEWRSFWRACRRRTTAFFNQPVVRLVSIAVAVCGAVACVAVVLFVSGAVIVHLPNIFFSPPKRHRFESHEQRALVGLTRLTTFQTVLIPLILLSASFRFRSRLSLEQRKFHRGRDRVPRLGWRIGLAAVLVCSLAVYVGATFDNWRSLWSAAVAALVFGSLGWLVLGIGRWLTATRLPGSLSHPETQAGTIVILSFLSLMPVPGVLYGPTVLTISQKLQWLGPMGALNRMLLNVHVGHFPSLAFLGLLCIAAGIAGSNLNRRADGWAFRRRLLLRYRSEEPPHSNIRKIESTIASAQQIARDVRQSLSITDWDSWSRNFGPRWFASKITWLVLFGGTMLVFQAACYGLGVLLAPLDEIRVVGPTKMQSSRVLIWSLAASVPGWSIIFLEWITIFTRDLPELDFRRRPVSPIEFWRDLEFSGLMSFPMYLLFAMPFVVIPSIMATEYGRLSFVVLSAGLLSCVAIRTASAALILYIVAMERLGVWFQLLLAPVMFMATALLCAASLWPISLRSPVAIEVVFRCVVMQLATIAAFGLAWGVWFLLSQPNRFLHRSWPIQVFGRGVS